jgi:hypothetical protein
VTHRDARTLLNHRKCQCERSRSPQQASPVPNSTNEAEVEPTDADVIEALSSGADQVAELSARVAPDPGDAQQVRAANNTCSARPGEESILAHSMAVITSAIVFPTLKIEWTRRCSVVGVLLGAIRTAPGVGPRGSHANTSISTQEPACSGDERVAAAGDSADDVLQTEQSTEASASTPSVALRTVEEQLQQEGLDPVTEISGGRHEDASPEPDHANVGGQPLQQALADPTGQAEPSEMSLADGDDPETDAVEASAYAANAEDEESDDGGNELQVGYPQHSLLGHPQVNTKCTVACTRAASIWCSGSVH